MDIKDIKRRYQEASEAWNKVEDELLAYGLSKYQPLIDSAKSLKELEAIEKKFKKELPDSTTTLILKSKIAKKKSNL